MKINENIELEWKIGENEKNKKEIEKNTKIFFRVRARVERGNMLGVGFSGHGEFGNADMVVLWTDEGGSRRFDVRFFFPDN